MIRFQCSYIFTLFTFILLFLGKNEIYISASEDIETLNPEKISRELAPQQPKHNNDNNKKKQIMHTFYAHIDRNIRGTGMTDKGDRNQLMIWQEMWRAAGWETKILTLEDAKKHPHYKMFSDKLSSKINKVYDQLCFLRWLAMAANGGGWMCDYDVFPMPNKLKDPDLHPDSPRLPYGGKLTVYEYTNAGGVPSIISGRAEEWDRVAHRIFDTQQKFNLLSDMFALIKLHKTDPDDYLLRDKVAKGHFALDGNHSKGDHMCQVFREKLALHISHAAITAGRESGVLGNGANANSRPDVARDYLENYVKECKIKKETS